MNFASGSEKEKIKALRISKSERARIRRRTVKNIVADTTQRLYAKIRRKKGK
jgi:hypothetical protein|tara:strand:+ start:4135 stop:4290 length:156 start_codon:yes stop_codon:yes gene_type:complete